MLFDGARSTLLLGDILGGTIMLRHVLGIVALAYSMTTPISLAEDSVPWVFNAPRDENIAPDLQQQTAEIDGPGGKLTLSQTVVVPKNAKELRLFIPVVPDGLEETTGEIVLRYPIGN